MLCLYVVAAYGECDSCGGEAKATTVAESSVNLVMSVLGDIGNSRNSIS